MATEKLSLWNPAILQQAFVGAFTKLNPRLMVKNPVMFVVEVGSVLTTALFIQDLLQHKPGTSFNLQITLWLWFTVLFANFAEAMAEGRGKAQADTLRKAKGETMAYRFRADGTTEAVSSSMLRTGDIIRVEAGQFIAGDGEVIEGVASVDESAITGESAPVIREAGGDRSAVTGGTRVLSDWVKIKITSNPGETFLDRMIALVEGAERQKTPNEIALSILLSGLTIVFLLAVATLQPFAIYSHAPQTVFVLVSLLVCLIPTTIGGLLSAIGIAGMDRLVQYNVLAMSGRAVEAAGDVNTLLLDKTGTITLGNRQATEFFPAPEISTERLADAAQLASFSDETPEGRSIVVLAKEKYNLRGRDLTGMQAEFVAFTAQTRMSGVDLPGTKIRKGSADAIAKYLESLGSSMPRKVTDKVEEIARLGGTPLVVVENTTALGVVYLKDIVKGGLKDRLARLRAMGIRTIMITGDNPLTAAVIAREAGVDDFLAEAKPKDKMDLIKREQAKGKLVAMTGDGTNDAPALAQADVGVAMNSGTQAAKGGRQHGRPRLQPDQAHRDRRDRQAVAHDPRRAHHLLHRQRRRKILRHHPRHVRRSLPRAQRAQHHAPANAALGDSVGSDLQRAHHHRACTARAQGSEVRAKIGAGAIATQSAHLRSRRHHRPIPRHQGNRRSAHKPPPGLEGC